MEKQTNHAHHSRFHVGMRMFKTVLAVFLCGVITELLKQDSFYCLIAMISAVICLQNSAGETLKSSINRAAGTLIGGVVGAVCVYLMDAIGVLWISMARYLILSLMLIPLIQFTLLIKKPAIAAVTCVVFLCVAVSNTSGEAPAVLAFQRVVATLAGVAVAYGVDLLLPHHLPAPPQAPPAGEDPSNNKGAEKP